MHCNATCPQFYFGIQGSCLRHGLVSFNIFCLEMCEQYSEPAASTCTAALTALLLAVQEKVASSFKTFVEAHQELLAALLGKYDVLKARLGLDPAPGVSSATAAAACIVEHPREICSTHFPGPVPTIVLADASTVM